jgi:leucyl-tRNA synthetase
MYSQDAVKRIGAFLAKKKIAQKSVHYKLRDWVFSRQHYWGEPIPLVFCPHCQKKIKEGKDKKMFSKGELMNPGWITVLEKDLPVKLPDVKSYKPTDTGESPLSEINFWVKTRCPRCGREAWRETDTMPNWAGSNWYYLRYCDPRRKTSLAAGKKLLKWMPVDWYNGGMEHTTLHLLYSRFVYKFLWDIKAVPRSIGSEPYLKRTSHGVILGEGGVKMSKSKGNVVNPEEVINNYGADTLRLYEMFVGPFSEAIAWDDKGVKGMKRFLDRIWALQDKVNRRVDTKTPAMRRLNKTLHKTIKKVSQDIDELKFNTAVAALMILVNDMENQEKIPSKYFSLFLTILSPFAPHIAEELWHLLWKKKKTIFLEKWPDYDPKILAENKFELVIQINGKLRDRVEVDLAISKKSAERISRARPKVKKWLAGKKIKKIIFVPKKLINFVI